MDVRYAAVAVLVVGFVAQAFGLPRSGSPEKGQAENSLGQQKDAKAKKPKVVVKLESGGQEPRSALRYIATKGTEQSIVMSVKTDMTIEMNGFKRPNPKMSTQRIRYDLTITEVSPAGDITYTFVVSKIDLVDTEGVSNIQLQQQEKMLEPLVGMKGSSVVSNRGIVRRARFETKDAVDPRLKKVLDGLSQRVAAISSPFPVEPVGNGASWNVKNSTTANGIKLQQVTTYRLILVSGDIRKIDIRVEQKSEPQAIQPPGLSAGATASLKSIRSVGKGNTLIDLKMPVPRQSEMVITSKTKMTVTGRGKDQTINTDIKMSVLLETLARASK